MNREVIVGGILGQLADRIAEQDSFARSAGLVHDNSGPDSGPDNGDSSHLPATLDDSGKSSEASFDHGKPRGNALLATAGNTGQNGKDRPGRT